MRVFGAYFTMNFVDLMVYNFGIPLKLCFLDHSPTAQ